VRPRTLVAAAAAVLAVTGLTGCRTNVGTAAVVDGHRITDSDVSQYLTPDSQPVSERLSTGATRQVSPRSFVLAQLINERLGFRILAKIPQVSSMTSQQLDAKLDQDIAGRSVKSVAEGLGLKGYPTSFYRIVLRVQELSSVISSAAQSGADLRKIISTLDFPVSISPRYGKWDKATLAFDSSTVIPSYLTVQPGGSPAALPGAATR
jgi:hypothetical protein